MRRATETLLLAVLVASMAGCSGLTDVKNNSGAGGGGGGGTQASGSISISPSAVTVQPFGARALTASVSGSSSTGVTWQVNGVTGGSQTTGLISTSGMYSAPLKIAPSLIPTSGADVAVTITAISQANATATGTATVTLQPQQQATQASTVQMGTSGGNINDTATGVCCSGTLGSLVSLGGTQYILSNNHVLALSDGGGVGDAISQPGLIETNCETAGTQTVANLSQFFNLESGPAPKIDAALAQVASGKVDSTGNILLLGATQTNGVPDAGAPAQGAGITPSQAMAAPHNGLVAKSGRTTGLTCSTVLAMNVASSVDYYRHCGDTTAAFTVNYTDLVSVSGGDFSAEGDSGNRSLRRTPPRRWRCCLPGRTRTPWEIPWAKCLNAFTGNSGSPTFVGGFDRSGDWVHVDADTGGGKGAKPAGLRGGDPQRFAGARYARAGIAGKYGGGRDWGGTKLRSSWASRDFAFVNSHRSLAGLPRSINGVSTRVIQGESWALHGMLEQRRERAASDWRCRSARGVHASLGRAGAREGRAEGTPS